MVLRARPAYRQRDFQRGTRIDRSLKSSRVVYLGILAAFDSSITCSRRLSTDRTDRSLFETTDFARSPGRRKSNLATPYNASIRSLRRIRRTKKIVVTARMTAARLNVIHRAKMFLSSIDRAAVVQTGFQKRSSREMGFWCITFLQHTRAVLSERCLCYGERDVTAPEVTSVDKVLRIY